MSFGHVETCIDRNPFGQCGRSLGPSPTLKRHYDHGCVVNGREGGYYGESY
jgi:hypothetical protein